MRTRRRPQWRFFVCWAAGLGMAGAALTNAALAACLKTPAAAVAGAIEPSEPSSAVALGGGFRITSVRWDSVLRHSWARVASCSHPEWPAIELPSKDLPLDPSTIGVKRHEVAESLLPLLPLVRAGDIVKLWSHEDHLRIEVAAVAEGSGALGKIIRVRLMQRNTPEQQAVKQFSGVIRGPHDVEMER